MKFKRYALIGAIAPAIFIITYLIMAGIRPEYSHYTKAISELGSVDAYNRMTWNLIGYILVGSLISLFGFGLYRGVARETEGGTKLPLYGLILSGAFMALSGIFPGNFEDRTSMTMVMHAVGSIGSFFFFLLAAFTYPTVLNKTYFWKKAHIPSIGIAVLCIVSGFLRTGEMPGIGQRIGFLLFFIWIWYMAWMLFRYGQEIEEQSF